jgi:TolB-like protein/DNA-binding winged helix-turn-helix (wHTH) protein/Tfp pilus assembly protein PilF
MSQEPAFLRIGDFTLRTREGLLVRGDRRERLEPKVMAVLAYLVERRERIVSKEEILTAVWPDTAVEEVALARSISELRRAFGDDAKTPRYIETFPKRGYRFIARVSAADRPSGDDPAASRSAAFAGIRLGALALATLVLGVLLGWELKRRAPAPSPAPLPSVAVLPFRNLSPDPANDYFADGLSEDVITQLSKISGLRVVSPSSVTPSADNRRSARERGKALGVSALLEGSVRREGNRVRIAGQLVDAEKDTHLWAQTYDLEVGDIFDVQRDVAERIALALQARLTAEDRSRLAFTPTAEPSAYDVFLRARTFYEGLDRTSTENAISLLEKAVAIDPRFALAHAARADAYARLSTQTADRRPALTAVEAARQALALDPHLAEAHKALGHALAVEGQYRGAQAAYQKALELRPNYWVALNNLSILFGNLGDWDRAYRLRRETLALDPARAVTRSNFGELLRLLAFDQEAAGWLDYALELQPYFYPAQDGLAILDLYRGNHQAAEERMRRQLAVDASCRGCLVMLGLLDTLQGRDDAARRHLERSLELPGDPTVARLRLAQIHWRAGEGAMAKRWLERAAEGPRSYLEQGSEWWGPPWSLAAIASIEGDPDAAVRWFERAFEAGRRDYRWDEMDPLFENARRDARFQALLLKMRRRVASMREAVVDIPRAPVASRLARREPR